MSDEQSLAAEDWHRLNGLLKDALYLDEATRSRWLADLPAEALDLKPMLERLLSTAALDGTSQTLQPVVQMAAAAISAMRREQPGDRFGPWRLERLLAEGGMGTVWVAQRADGVMQRTAALKLPRAEWVDHGLAERIARERAILARLQHPNIAVLYDAGLGTEGRPYLALEFIDGQAIDAWCAGREPAEIVRLFVQVVRAVAYAHSQLVIHRDIKPGNVLVTADGAPKLLDFGISKLLEADAPTAHETALTRLTGRALTLAYAAPEQVQGLPVAVMADVYALGVLLFELLAQCRLYRAQEPRALEAELLAGNPRAPSAAAPDRTRAKLLRGDLDAIVLNALKLDPAERYQSAAAFADDLDRYLAGEPVRARPDSRAYRARKFFARNRLAVAATGTVVLALTAGLGVALWQAGVARDQAQRATAMNSFVLSLIRQADPLASRQMKEADLALLATIEERIDTEFKGAPDQQLQLRVTVGDAYRNRGEMVAARRVFQRAIEAATPHLPADDLMLLTAQVRASDFHLIVSTAAAEQLDRAIDLLRRKGPAGAELLIDALLTRHDLAHNFGIPAYLEPQQRLDALREANDLALKTFGEGSRQQMRVVWPMAEVLWGIEGGEKGWRGVDSSLAQARLRSDGASSSVEYLLLQARGAAARCGDDESRRPEGRALIEQTITAVRAAYGPTSAQLEQVLLALGGCDDAAAWSLSAQVFDIAAARERPPSTALLVRALDAFGAAIQVRELADAERFYQHMLVNMEAIPEPALRDRLTIHARIGRVCQLTQRGDAAEATRVAAPLKAGFDADFARIGRLTPAQAGFWICLSDAHRQLGHFDAARISAQSFADRCRATRLAAAADCTSRALSALAVVHLDAGQLDEARAVMDQRLAISPSANRERRFPIAHGRILIATGRAAEAIEPLRAGYENWVASSPDVYDAAELLFWLGQAHRAHGDNRGKAMLAQARKTLAASPLKTHQRLAVADKPL